MTKSAQPHSAPSLLRLLLVEDREDDAEIILRALDRHGFRVEHTLVGSAAAMRSALTANQWDLIISDYFLPGFSAVDALEVYREAGRDIPFIVVSGSVGEEAAVAAMRAGVHDYVMKGNLKRLGVVVERELREAEIRRERALSRSERDRLSAAQARAERNLIRSEEHLNLALVAAQLGAWSLDLETGQIECSDQYRQNFGVPLDGSFSQADMLSLVHPEDVDRVRAAIQKSVRDRIVYEAEYRVLPPDGTERWMLAVGRVVDATDGMGQRMIGVNRNITERKLAEDALRVSESRFRLMADSTPALIWMSDEAGERVWFNRSWLEFTGADSESAAGAGWTRIIHPDDLERTVEACRHAFSRQESFRVEYRLRGCDGDWHWVLDHGTPLGGPGAGTQGFIGSAVDITDRKKAEQALQESEQRFRAIIDNIPNLSWMADADGYIFWYNRRWYEYTGTTPDQMEGWGWRSVHRPELIEATVETWKNALATGEPLEMEFPLRRADGEFRWFLTQVRPVRNDAGEVVRWFGTNTDIDEKRRFEEALRQSEELASSVIDGNPDGVEVLSAEGETLLINEQGRRFRKMNGGAGADAPWANCWAPADQPAARQAFSAALSGGRAHFETMPERDGGIVRWEISVTPLFGPDGKVPRVLCVTRDVTAERRAEEELRQTAKLESLGVMAGGIAHDFNNLLTGILGNASLLCDSLSGPDRELAEDISLAGERAADLTQQMLAFAGKGRFQVSRFDVSLLVQEILRLVRPSIQKNIELHLNLQPACMVEGDSGQMQQVIMNLLINAGEAMDGRPGLISVRTCKVSIDRVYLSQTLGPPETPEGEYVCLEINDNGSGMDAATKARIFDPFFTTKFAGRGLGLAAVLGIVRGHKGLLHVYSEPGRGTTFRVLFPSMEPSAPPAPPAASLRHGYGVVLLADDEEIVQRVASEVLTRQGYEVRLARNGEEAVRLYRENRDSIRLVILDLTMPVMNGEQALRCLAEQGNAAPVIVSSGYTEAAITGRFETEKVDGFLQKPYTAAKLLEKVENVLQGR